MLRAMGHWANVPSQSQDTNVGVAGLPRLAVWHSIFLKFRLWSAGVLKHIVEGPCHLCPIATPLQPWVKAYKQ